MMITRLNLACIFISLALCGCSSENSTSDTQKADDGKKKEQPLNQSLVQPLLPPGVSLVPERGEQQVPVLPTRSELRVLAEQVKATDNEVKSVIEEFDANLGNLEARKAAEAKFKKSLPEYKEKMLQLGKAKLKEAN
jgi:uncharacterized lipoprotein